MWFIRGRTASSLTISKPPSNKFNLHFPILQSQFTLNAYIAPVMWARQTILITKRIYSLLQVLLEVAKQSARTTRFFNEVFRFRGLFTILTHFIIGQASAEEEPKDIITDDCFFKTSNVDAGACPAVSNILFTFWSWVLERSLERKSWPSALLKIWLICYIFDFKLSMWYNLIISQKLYNQNYCSIISFFSVFLIQ